MLDWGHAKLLLCNVENFTTKNPDDYENFVFNIL